VIRAVVFDMDGLMIDSEPLQKEAWQVTLRRFGYEMDEALFARLVGLRIRDDAVLLREHFRLPVMAEALARQRNDWFLASLPGRVKAMPGLHELIGEIAARGLRCALATSGERRYVEAVKIELNLDGVFDAIVVAEDVARGKPAPDVYLLAAECLGLPPAQCLVLEDAPNGVQAAKAAGMQCVAVPNDMTRSLDLSAADAILPSLLAVRDNLDVLMQL
jgi:HAD superfamily hydrolase (TIGR01509 family)